MLEEKPGRRGVTIDMAFVQPSLKDTQVSDASARRQILPVIVSAALICSVGQCACVPGAWVVRSASLTISMRPGVRRSCDPQRHPFTNYSNLLRFSDRKWCLWCRAGDSLSHLLFLTVAVSCSAHPSNLKIYLNAPPPKYNMPTGSAYHPSTNVNFHRLRWL